MNKCILTVCSVAILLPSLAAQAGKLNAEPSKEISWDGFSVGAQLGKAWNQSDWKFQNPNYFNTLGPAIVGNKFDKSSDAFIGGGYLAFNHSVGPVLLGLEASYLWTDLSASFVSPFFPDLDTFKTKINHFSTVKARIAYPIQQFLLSVSGGWAIGDVEVKLYDSFADITADTSSWVDGWTLGVALDYKLTEYFAVGVAYDYIQLNMRDEKLSCPTCGSGIGFGTPILDGDIQTQVATARFSYFFN